MDRPDRSHAFDHLRKRGRPRIDFSGLPTDLELRQLEQAGLLPVPKSGGLLMTHRELVEALESGQMLSVEFEGSAEDLHRYIADVKAGRYDG